jgi:hypothetical protein
LVAGGGATAGGFNPAVGRQCPGKAVITWRRGRIVLASYRSKPDAAWSSPERVFDTPSVGYFNADIDDAGRVVVVHDTKHGVEAVRRLFAGGWGRPHRFERGTFGSTIAVGADGAAVVGFSHMGVNNRPDGHFTARMTSAGNWRDPVRQPPGRSIPLRGLDVDTEGRALAAWWDGSDLKARWSRPDGVWRKPKVVAAHQSKPHSKSAFDTQVTVNGHGDAVLVWRVKAEVEQLWAALKLAGRPWTQPFRVSRNDGPPRSYSAAIGECGHAAIAWTTEVGRLTQVRRATPAP